MAGEELQRPEDARAADADAHRAARRQLIKSAVAAFPVVLTVTAGTARAQASITSATASATLKAGALEGGSEEFDVQKYLDEVTSLESDATFIKDPGGIGSEGLSMPPDPVDPGAIEGGPIGPYGF